ncbi:molybdopterin-guanine dinucleotide biosynthesis protein A [Ancylobacter novellus DSM 506]|uniref:Molybdenum cofactor guanylyltransferase n=1 Tax=Ancylobacter novellus (strain ATCC 8093 / DSM 506 / JCM 20403 / CCM 1077 / IAM 12100 / NBRC 12443 / NCIMB 10456) TaxID=639283 RepID=D7AAJ4_ANCN5|nr:molybdenum cofactor guanylyltransferase MobA [Ancylobacter novellus]ADH88997.1 molybdopterin-guanine dinucleotide biosynthesis protein A [Ancylobacter novellus DSM 506]
MDKPVGLILAGGLSRRMGGGDKALRALGGEAILARIVRRIGPQVSMLLLNANGPAERFGVELPVVPDSLPDTPGPLAGILAGLDHVAAAFPGARYLLTVPADCPFLPADLATRLGEAAERAGAAYAASGGRTHPVVGLWPVAARDELRRLLADGERRVDRWTERVGAVAVEWPAEPFDPFFNVNTPDDLAEAERLLAAYPAL